MGFATALKMYHAGEADGIGFMLGDGFAGVDLDECRNVVTDEIDPWAAEIIGRFPTYGEVSPSGTGIKLFCYGKLPEGRRRNGNIELYSETRYFTFTGQRLECSPLESTDCQTQIEELQREITPQKSAKPKPPRPETTLDDQQLLDKAMGAKNGDKFRRLWEGKGNGTSQSEDDLALCNLLAFWTGGDAERIDQLFRQSGLYRDKWERQDYRDRTIALALEDTTEYYRGNGHQPPRREPPTSKTAADGPQIGVQIITDYWRDRYKPLFRRNNRIHCVDGSEIELYSVCVPDSYIIELLAGAADAPHFTQKNGGQLNRDALPEFFYKWGKVAFGDMLRTLPEEINAKTGDDAPARDRFRQLVREAMLQEVVIGDVIKHQNVTQTERRSLIGWCAKWAKTGPWRQIRSKLCWCKITTLETGECKLRVAIRCELFAQVKGDRWLCSLGQYRFTQFAEKYGVGTTDRKDRPHGKAAVLLSDDLVEELTAGMEDEEAENLVEPDSTDGLPEGSQNL